MLFWLTARLRANLRLDFNKGAIIGLQDCKSVPHLKRVCDVLELFHHYFGLELLAKVALFFSERLLRLRLLLKVKFVLVLKLLRLLLSLVSL